MKTLPAKQKGITILGLIFVFAFIGCVVLMGVRIFPLYNEKLSVITAMKSVVNQPDAAKMSDTDLRKRFLKNAGINGVNRFNDKNVKDHVKVEKSKEGKMFHITFEARNKLFADIELALVFDQSFPLGGSGGE